MTKEYKFKGLDNGANIKSGIIVAVIITVVTAIGFYFFNEKIKTCFSAIFSFSAEFLLLVKPFSNQKETYNQGYRIINLSKNN